MEKQINELIEKYKLPQKEHNTILELLKKDLFVDKITEKKSINYVGYWLTRLWKNNIYKKYKFT